MKVRMRATEDEARRRLEDAIAAVGWRVDWPATGPAKLSQSDADPAQAGWLLLTATDTGAELVIWLPEEGPPTPRLALENALVRLAEPVADESRLALQRRLRRIEGQIRGLQRMIETDRECEAVLTQFSAVSAALKQTAACLVSEHLVECVREELSRGGEATAINQRLLNILF